MSRLELIAHRGEPENWPENTLAGFRHALAAGARYLETDVQLTRDGVAILCHDPTLARVTGHDLPIAQTDYAAICELPAAEADRFGTRHADQCIARLDEFTALLAQWPQARAFVEVKPTASAAHARERVVDRVLDILDAVAGQCILISFDPDVLVYARSRCRLPVGWVIPGWSPENRLRAGELAPQYLFCNRKRLPGAGEPLWEGAWRWVVYTVNAVEDIPQFTERGICMLETNAISRLLADPRLREAECERPL